MNYKKNKVQLKKDHIIELIGEALLIVQSMPIVSKIRPPVKVFGSLHGNYLDLLRFFDQWKSPVDISNGGDIDSFDYVFLGNYVDRGAFSIETICLLIALKVKYPE